MKLINKNKCESACKSGFIEDILSTFPRIEEDFDNKVVEVLLNCMKKVAKYIPDEKRMEKIGGGDLLIHFLDLCSNIHHKQIIAYFFCYFFGLLDYFIKHYVVILDILKDILINNGKDSSVTVQEALDSLSHVVNKNSSPYFLKGGFISIILNFFDDDECDYRKNAAFLFQRICNNSSSSFLESLFNDGIFTRLLPYVSSYADNYRETVLSQSSSINVDVPLISNNNKIFYHNVLLSLLCLIKLKSLQNNCGNIKKTNQSYIKEFISSPFLNLVLILVASDSYVPFEILNKIIFIDKKISKDNLKILLKHNLMKILTNKIIKLSEKDKGDYNIVKYPLLLLFYIAFEGSHTSLPNHPNKYFSLFKNALQESLKKIDSLNIINENYYSITTFEQPLENTISNQKRNVKILICLIFCFLYKGLDFPPHLFIYPGRLQSLLYEGGMWIFDDINVPELSDLKWEILVDAKNI
jgi:hypothetical protein